MLLRVIQLLLSQRLGTEGVQQMYNKCECIQTLGRGWGSCQWERSYIDYNNSVFFISFVKALVWLKISVLKELFFGYV